MSFEPAFRIHLADPLGFTDCPLILTAVYPAKNGLGAEWFLIIPEGKGSLLSQSSRLEHLPPPDSRLHIDEQLLLDEALDQARVRLRRYVLENKGTSAPLLLATPTAMHPADHHYLVRLWMRGAYCGCLSEIRAKTHCPALADNLAWIHSLPMLTLGEL
jgi:hypothetical protein